MYLFQDNPIETNHDLISIIPISMVGHFGSASNFVFYKLCVDQIEFSKNFDLILVFVKKNLFINHI